MSVIIKNIRKPENCEDCYKFGRRISSETIECSVDTGWAYESNRYIRHDCPLVALPEKHGRLIDVDEYCELQGCDGEDDSCRNCIIRDCETILESEE